MLPTRPLFVLLAAVLALEPLAVALHAAHAGPPAGSGVAVAASPDHAHSSHSTTGHDCATCAVCQTGRSGHLFAPPATHVARCAPPVVAGRVPPSGSLELPEPRAAPFEARGPPASLRAR